MINLSASTLADIEQISEWAKTDPYHFHQGQPEWWLTGNGSLLAFCLMDDVGPLAYVRLDAEGSSVRLHTQFAPREIVSRERLVAGMIPAIKVTIPYLQSEKFCGIVFNSVSSSLVGFMAKPLFGYEKGFEPVGNDDYLLTFEEQR